MPVVHSELGPTSAGGLRCAGSASAWMPGVFKLKTALRAFCPGMTDGRTERTKERKKEYRRRNADRRKAILPCLGHGRAPIRGAHIYRRSTAVLVPRSLSSQGTQHQAFASWDLASLLSGRYPPLPVPVQRVIAPPVIVTGYACRTASDWARFGANVT